MFDWHEGCIIFQLLKWLFYLYQIFYSGSVIRFEFEIFSISVSNDRNIELTQEEMNNSELEPK